MDYYNEIKTKIIDNEIYATVKDYSKERNRVITYFEIGKLLTEAGNVYGEDIIGQYSKKLMIEVGKKYNRRTLFRMRQFYILFSDEKVSPLVTLLNWSQCLLLLPLKDLNKIIYYINQVKTRNLTKRQLEEIIKSKEYERLPQTTKNKLINKTEDNNITDYIKDPIIIKNKNNYDEITEKVLQRIILEDIDNFLEELGEGFSYIGSEYKIRLGNNYNYIDLLLFNIKYNCYVVVELKVTELKKEHIGQIQVYMNYIDKNIKREMHDKTIGLIIVRKNNRFVLEYSSDKRILVKEYDLV